MAWVELSTFHFMTCAISKEWGKLGTQCPFMKHCRSLSCTTYSIFLSCSTGGVTLVFIPCFCLLYHHRLSFLDLTPIKVKVLSSQRLDKGIKMAATLGYHRKNHLNNWWRYLTFGLFIWWKAIDAWEMGLKPTTIWIGMTQSWKKIQHTSLTVHRPFLFLYTRAYKNALDC